VKVLSKLLDVCLVKIQPVLCVVRTLVGQPRLDDECVEQGLAFHVKKAAVQGGTIGSFFAEDVHVRRCDVLQQAGGITASH